MGIDYTYIKREEGRECKNKNRESDDNSQSTAGPCPEGTFQST